MQKTLVNIKRRPLFVFLTVLFILGIQQSAFSKDWELWTQDLFSVPLNKRITYNILPEWRFKNDMDYNYLFKMETGPSFKINNNFDLALWYVYVEKQSVGIWDRSDLTYFDVNAKTALKNLFDLKISNRLRYQYDFDKANSTVRNSLRFLKGFNAAKILEIAPYLSEEPFYDCKINRIVEHRSTTGFIFTFFKNYSLNFGYMFNSKKQAGASKWRYTNVLITNANIRF